MTEIEAYETLGWPLEGSVFILPITGDPGTEYIAERCACGYSQIARTEEAVTPCIGCGKKMYRLEKNG